jgi:hypothetical protein
VKLRYVAALLFALSLPTASGCSRKAVPKAIPSSQASTLSPDPKLLVPPPEPELAPGEPVRLTLPSDGGAWPWSVGRADAPLESRAMSFPGLTAFAVTGFAVRPEVNRALVSLKWEKKGQSVATRLTLCDTATGKVLTEWQIAGQQAVIDLSPDGRAILTANANPGRGRTILRLWVIGSDGQLRLSFWTPHSTSRPDGIRNEPGDRSDVAAALEIRWAGFVGNDRIVSSSRTGQLRVFETDGVKPLISLEGSPGRPAITPDGTKVALFTGNAVTLVDPTSGTIIGTRWVGQLPQHPVLAFSPDGSKLAIGGNGKALLLNLTTGDVQQVVLPKLHVTDTGMYDKPFGWAGNTYLFADGHLHDLRFPGSVWDYVGVEHMQFRGSRIWACVRPVGSTTSTLAAYDLPHPQALAQIAAAVNRPDLFAFKTGDGVRIDVSGVPENRRDEVQKTLEERLRTLGHHSDPAAPAVLFASVETAGTKTSTSYSGFDTYSYMKTPAVLRLVVNGKELWSDAWAIEPPFSIKVPFGVTLTDHLKQFTIGAPNYKLFANAPLPSFIPGPQSPTVPFGTIELNTERLKGRQIW